MSLINYITQIQFDIGAIALLPAECERIGITKPLIVTDRGVRAAGIVDTALNTFADSAAQLPIYDGTPPNPNETAVREAVAMFKECGCDGIIAIGSGGSYALSAARALMAHTELDARTIASEAIGIAGDICIYTNRNVVVEEL